MSQSLQPPPSDFGIFATLPREIRHQIYALVFPTSPTLRLASTALRDETEPWLYKYGIYRTHITFHRTTTARDSYTYYTVSSDHSASACLTLQPACIPAPTTLANIQHIDICINMPEPYTHCTYDTWTHYTPGPGGFITDVVERIVLPMKSRKYCRLTFILGSVGELHPMHEPRMLDYLALLRGFKNAVLELRRRPWMGKYPHYFGNRSQAENDTEAIRMQMLKNYLGFGGEMQEVEGKGSRVKIVRSTLGSEDVEVLWDSSP